MALMEAVLYFFRNSAVLAGLRMTLIIAGIILITISIILLTARLSQPISPWIIFLSDRDGERQLYRMRSDGSRIKQLTFDLQVDYLPTWSPKGERMIYVASRNNPPRIYLAQQDRRTDRSVIDGGGYQLQPAWSPDGEWIAFSSNLNGGYEIYRVRLDGTERYQMTDRANNDWNPAWSPDGQWVVFESDNDGHRDIYLIPSDNTIAQTVSFADEQGGASRTIIQTEVDETTSGNAPPAKAAPAIRLTDTPGDDGQMAWSPDSQWIAFISERDGNPELYRMRPDGSEVTRLTFNAVIDTNPTWSPDGGWIAFESDQDGNREIYRIRPDGSEQTRLTYHEGLDYHAQWTPVVDLPWRGIFPLLLGLILLGLNGGWLRRLI
jgi:TolB protein